VTHKPTHIIVEILDQPVGVYIDSGSSFCIVSGACLKDLKVPTQNIKKFKEPIYLQPINGKPCSSTYYVNLMVTFSNITLDIEFLILEEMACDIMLGIDKLKELSCQIDYSTDTLTVHSVDDSATLQLYTKQELCELLEEDDFSIDSDEELPPSFLLKTVNLAYLRDLPPVCALNDANIIEITKESVPAKIRQHENEFLVTESQFFAAE
jgi:hypothetical protein